MFQKQSYTYKVAGNQEIQADVYRLPDDVVRPAIFWLHGGALIIGSRGWLSPDQLQRYLQAGFTVIAVDYRLAPEVKLEAIIDDIQDAYAWVRTKGPELFRIEADRIAVIGHSAGGYLTLLTGHWLRPRPQALVSFYGYGDIAGHWYSRPDPHYGKQAVVPKEEAYQAIGGQAITGTPFEGRLLEERYRYYVYCRQHGLWPKEVTGHDPDNEPDWFNAFCPIRNVTAEYPPTLLIHGEQDTDVPFEQSFLMAKELTRHSVQHQLIALNDRGHVFDEDGDGMRDPVVSKVFDQVLAFLTSIVDS